ncbi:MAG TPA: VCBS repeat-containing protein [Opitutaceae bacterium]
MGKNPKRAVVVGALVGIVMAGSLGVILSERWNRSAAAIPPAERREAVAAPDLAYVPTSIGAPVSEFGRPAVTNVHLADLDLDGLLDVLYCEAQLNTVRWIRQSPRGMFTERVIGEDIPGPAHVWAGDVSGNGRLDVLVASMGQITPNNDRIGAVVALENLDNRRFRSRVLSERIARVSDVRGANLSGHADERLDLVIGQFGYSQGETRWMQNKGGWNFESHLVSTLSGCVHTPVADFDGDGRIDFAALISQEWEEIYLFRNPGAGGDFRGQVIWGSINEDYGCSGLEAADINRDGKPDLIYTNGDGFDYAGSGSRPWHGVQWLENLGEGRFEFHRVGDMPGAYAPCVADLNGDGFLDVLAASAFADWSDPEAVSMKAWLNDGLQNFTEVVLAQRPTHLVTAAVGDLDGNGVPVIVTGGFHFNPPYDNMSNITVWRRK